MAIVYKCPCGSNFSIKRHKLCPSCGKKPSRNGEFKVDVKYRGRRITKTVRGLLKAREIEEALRGALVSEKIFGFSIFKEEKQSITIDYFFKKYYLSWFFTHSKSHSRNIEGFWRKWITVTLGEKTFSELSITDIEKIKTFLIEAGKSPRTIEHILAILRAVINKAIEWGFFQGENPVSKVKLPKYDNKRTRFLTREEAQKLLEECKKRTTRKNWIYPIVLTALTTGMRASEIFNLKWQDIDFKHNLIHIRDPKNRKNRIAYL